MPTARKPREQDVVAQCLRLLALRGAFCWRQNCGGMRYARPGGGTGFVRFTSVDGVSDVVGVLPDGRMVAVECKRPGGRVRDSQRAFLARVSDRGGLALVVSDVAQLQQALDAEGV